MTFFRLLAAASLAPLCLSGCTAAVIAADVAITATSVAVSAATTVVGGAIDLVTPSSDEKKK